MESQACMIHAGCWRSGWAPPAWGFLMVMDPAWTRCSSMVTWLVSGRAGILIWASSFWPYTLPPGVPCSAPGGATRCPLLTQGTQVSCITGKFFTVWATKEADEINYHTSKYRNKEKIPWDYILVQWLSNGFRLIIALSESEKLWGTAFNIFK